MPDTCSSRSSFPRHSVDAEAVEPVLNLGLGFIEVGEAPLHESVVCDETQWSVEVFADQGKQPDGY